MRSEICHMILQWQRQVNGEYTAHTKWCRPFLTIKVLHKARQLASDRKDTTGKQLLDM